MAIEPATRALIADLSARGYSTHAVARSLNARHVPTASGRGQWWPYTVAAALDYGKANRERMRRYRAREDWGR